MSWVDVWRIALPEVEDTTLLDEEERKRADSFRSAHDRRVFVGAHAALRRILARYVEGPLCFATGSHGKPALSPPQVRFNLAHSDELALLAVSPDREVGIDVEPVRELAADAARYFSPAEQKALGSLPERERPLAFFLAWTRKEAYIKARGRGLSLPLDSFDVELRPGVPAALLATRPDAEDVIRWRLHGLDVGPEYAAALAVEGDVDRITIRTEG